jgi:hypothetical protein
MRRYAVGQRVLPAFRQQLVRALHHRRENPVPMVSLSRNPPVEVGNSGSSRPPRCHALCDARTSRRTGSKWIDRIPASVYGAPDLQPPTRVVQVSDQRAEPASLARGPASMSVADKRVALRPRSRVGVELARAIEHRHDRIDAVQMHRARARDLEPPPPLLRRVARQVLVLHRLVENAAQALERLVDRGR